MPALAQLRSPDFAPASCSRNTAKPRTSFDVLGMLFGPVFGKVVDTTKNSSALSERETDPLKPSHSSGREAATICDRRG